MRSERSAISSDNSAAFSFFLFLFFVIINIIIIIVTIIIIYSVAFVLSLLAYPSRFFFQNVPVIIKRGLLLNYEFPLKILVQNILQNTLQNILQNTRKRPALVTTISVKPRLNCDLNFVMKSSHKRLRPLWDYPNEPFLCKALLSDTHRQLIRVLFI